MPDEITEDQARPQDADEPAPTGEAGTEPDDVAESEGEAASGAATSDWPELEGYRDQLRAEHAAWTERLTTVQTQLASVRLLIGRIAAQYDALAIGDDMRRLRDEVLGGAGMIQEVCFDFDLERYVTLVWPVQADPRPALTEGQTEGEYRIDVWLGIGADGRAAVRVEGAKRLEAPLPTTRERLRRVLLGAMQAPRYVGAMAAAEPDPDTPRPQEEAESQGPPAPPPDAEPSEAATPRPGDTTDQPPPEEQVIPLGPSEEKR